MIQKRVFGVGLVLLLLLIFAVKGGAQSTPSFVAVQSGLWQDPATWGHSGVPIPDVTVPGPNSNVIIASGLVIASSRVQQVSSLYVQEGAILRGTPGDTLAFDVKEDIVNDGTILGAQGTARSPAGPVVLHTMSGRIINRGLIRGGDAGRYGGPGGWVDLWAESGDVENWGIVYGGEGRNGGVSGWVHVRSGNVLRQRGEVRGGDVLLWAPTVDTSSGRVIGRGTSEVGHGRVSIGADKVIFASSRKTRIAGRGVFLVTGDDGLIDLQDVETMGVLAREQGMWLIGGTGARWYATGNRARFAPFQSLGGAVHLWIDPSQRYLDNGLTLSELIVGAIDQGPGRVIAIPYVLLKQWATGIPGQQISLSFEVVNQGNRAATFTLRAQDTEGWDLIPTSVDTPLLNPGDSTMFTLTVDIPITATVGTTNTIVLNVMGENSISLSKVRVSISVRTRTAHLPWVGRRAVLQETTEDVFWTVDDAPSVSISWAGEGEGKPLLGRSLLIVSVSARDLVALDLAYWDGTRWIPIATTVDMDNLTEDGVWAALWDTASTPLTTAALIRARAWERSGAMGQTRRQILIEHPPNAVGTATFGTGTTVTLDATASTDLEGPIVAYRWDLGDGTIATDPIVTHSFTPGTFTVRLTVTDTAGLVDESVYVLDVTLQKWSEQETCGCASISLKNSGESPLPLPWEDLSRQLLGPDISTFGGGQMLRMNLAVEATLTPDSNALVCRVEQSVRGTWQIQTEAGPQERAWQWGGQAFPGGNDSYWGLVGYTAPSALLAAWDTNIRWVISPGWGWRNLNKGLPLSALNGEGTRLEMEYRARVAGNKGSCTCTWRVVITAREGRDPQVTIDGGC